MQVSCKLPLCKYSLEQLVQMVRDRVISSSEMNDELDERGVSAADLTAVKQRRRRTDVVMDLGFASDEDTLVLNS